MSENNEIDDIIKEIRNKNQQMNRDDSFEDFYTHTDSLPRRAEEPELTFSFEKEEPKHEGPEPEEVFIQKEIVKPVEEIDSITIDKDKPAEKSFDDSGVIGVIDDTPSEYQDEVLLDIDELEETDDMKGKNKKKIIIIVAVILVAVIAATVAVIAIKGKDKEEPSTTVSTTAPTTTEAPVIITNPLTGEEGYNASAVDVRPVACVVENSYYARPQWGIDDKKSPDIILEGEVEGGETRMLWFYADYTAVPDQIGPMRSARPPFIRFSEMFDAIFIHWGQSSSKGDYVGANTVFKQDDVDHINQMTASSVSYLFSRDSSRNSYGVEHTGVLNGDKLAQAIKDKGFRTEAGNRYTKFNFNTKEQKVSDTPCNTLGLTFSSRSATRDWTYSAEDKMYHTEDFSNSNIGFSDVARKNLLVLFDNTSYVVKNNYKGSGKSETYCDYGLSGGKGKFASLGTVIDITWTVENGMLVVKDENGKAISLNPGKTWIGWGSNNNNGSVTIG